MEIFSFIPLRDIGVSINNSYSLIGKEYRNVSKYAPSDTRLSFSLSFSFDKAKLRAFESFFISKQARVGSFFIRSLRVDFDNVNIVSSALQTLSSNKTFGVYARRAFIYNRRTKGIYEIQNVIIGNGVDQIYLKSGIDEFEKDDELENCYKVRFDSDTLRATKISPNRYKVDMSFKEVIDE
ncbi:TPA: hypothetical protein RPW15_001667 [Campylobacter fetus subsp. venerealis]|uniref:Uncharacterized protein n=1 Tax=Campylobacter fetus subsp. venerealis NCTC 10354 TaxID=983328 RepID=A0AAE6IXV1_CAMFE|nr:hypothetical protein [Campylobacter fetus]OCS25430.1 hypothetical protein CFVB10_08510 [Campylobacter fetus subsp. venerealis cfvB10]OCS29093.1 hypothetical protein CFVCCUG33900_08310 [Campylobacter fetus subsp. venerealis LMG 6570 = CCUG 33900]AIR80133.1 hypothetical protein CFV97608_0469 [Campylobacter fetus subsp. venerealis 97/608]EAK0836128.1 hypothetical protein [Campylobacter fetus]EGU23657.1 Hypothetical protein CFV354_0573 [Campylobacter fetus subsp. venerealis NCTC 10354]